MLANGNSTPYGQYAPPPPAPPPPPVIYWHESTETEQEPFYSFTKLSLVNDAIKHWLKKAKYKKVDISVQIKKIHQVIRDMPKLTATERENSTAIPLIYQIMMRQRYLAEIIREFSVQIIQKRQTKAETLLKKEMGRLTIDIHAMHIHDKDGPDGEKLAADSVAIDDLDKKDRFKLDRKYKDELDKIAIRKAVSDNMVPAIPPIQEMKPTDYDLMLGGMYESCKKARNLMKNIIYPRIF